MTTSTSVVATTITHGFRHETYFGNIPATARQISRSREADLQEVVIEHVHPVAEVAWIRGGRTRLLDTGLSPSDVHAARDASIELKGIPVTVRAILPNGYHYSATYLDGKQVFPPR